MKQHIRFVSVFLSGALAASVAFAADVTVYNDNLGLVNETRSFALKPGINEIHVDDVAAQIDPTSVHFKSLTAPDAVAVLEQNFEYDLISQDKLLQKYIGKEIELERFLGANGERHEVVKGTLLSNTDGKVLLSDGKIYVNPPGEPVLPSLPEGLITKPTLGWRVDAAKGGTHECEISYLTAGMSWRADYVLLLAPEDDAMDLNAWVTIDNHSGAGYKDARLKLVAGAVHRVQPPEIARGHAMKAMSFAAAAPQMAEKSFFEYHLYALERPSTLRENETKQIEMVSAEQVPVQKSFVYDGATGISEEFSDYTRTDPSYGSSGQDKVRVMLEFKNSAANRMGMPLPAGRVRVYKKDDDGALELIGEDSLDHTPKDETVRVQLGDAFDIVGERTRTDSLVDTKKRSAEESFEIKLRNHKDEDVTVRVVEHLYRWNQWKIQAASQEYRKKDAQTIEFEAPVKKDGESSVRYTVKYSW